MPLSTWAGDKLHGLRKRLTHGLYTLRAEKPKTVEADFDGSQGSTKRLFDALIDPALEANWDAQRRSFRHRLSYQISSGGMAGDVLEFTARTMIGAGYAAASGHREELLSRYSEAVRQGTDPRSKQYWLKCIREDQVVVENASVFIAILLNRGTLWARFDDETRKNLIAYADACSRKRFHASNWRWFKVIHHLFLETLGHRPESGAIRSELETIGSFYRGEGWYNDAGQDTERRFDHYNAWAFHYYGLLFCRLASDQYADEKEVLKRRARDFFGGYRHFFAPGRMPIAWGRSLIYRFGMLGFFGLYVSEGLARAEELGWIKSVTVDTVNGFLQKPILDKRGLLSMGWFRHCGAMLENYSGGGSPYWAFKFFSFLLLDPAHAYWKADPAPETSVPALHEIRSTGMTLRRGADAHAFFLNAGMGSTLYGWKYSKFAYSNLFLQTSRAHICDNGMVFKKGGRLYGRDLVHAFRHAGGGLLHSHWGCTGLPRLAVHSTLLPLADGYVLINETHAPQALDYEFTGFNLRRTGLSQVRNGDGLSLTSEQGVSRLGRVEAAAGRLFCRNVSRHDTMAVEESACPVYRARVPAGRSRSIFCVQASAGTVGNVRIEPGPDGLIVQADGLEHRLKEEGFFYA